MFRFVFWKGNFRVSKRTNWRETARNKELLRRLWQSFR